jgi:hypothetical protein
MAQLIAASTGQRTEASRRTRRLLFFCGIASSLLYVGGDILAAACWSAYSYTSQSISELLAIGSPARPWLGLIPYNPLVIAFGIGVCWSAGRKWAQRICGILIALYGVASQTGFFMPMHLRGASGSFIDTMHIVITMVIVLFIVLFIGFGSAGHGKAFRIYSFATLAVLVAFGALAGRQGPQIAANLPTPGLGIMERINVYSAMLWVAVLAIVLLREERASATSR